VLLYVLLVSIRIMGYVLIVFHLVLVVLRYLYVCLVLLGHFYIEVDVLMFVLLIWLLWLIGFVLIVRLGVLIVVLRLQLRIRTVIYVIILTHCTKTTVI
jgi:hypothetical protein